MPLACLLGLGLVLLPFAELAAGEMPKPAPEPAGITPALLENTSWLVEDIGGRGVIDRARTHIEFRPGGRVGGSTGCNRFHGILLSDGTGMKFERIMSTRRACVPALMDQEQRFLRALESVVGFRIEETGLLHLIDTAGSTLLRLSKEESPAGD